MPVASFSRSSIASKNSPALVFKARSSSSSESYPSAITPPSRITIGGFSLRELPSSSTKLGRGLASSASLFTCFNWHPFNADAISGNVANEAYSRVKSLGRADLRATRVRMRSISPIFLRCSRTFSWRKLA